MPGLQDAHPDALAPAAEVRVPRPLGAGLRCQSELDAWAGVPRAAMPDADRWAPLLGAAAEKLAAREPDGPVRADSAWADLRSADQAQSAALYKPAAAPSAARSSVVQELQAAAAHPEAVALELAAQPIAPR